MIDSCYVGRLTMSVDESITNLLCDYRKRHGCCVAWVEATDDPLVVVIKGLIWAPGDSWRYHWECPVETYMLELVTLH